MCTGETGGNQCSWYLESCGVRRGDGLKHIWTLSFVSPKLKSTYSAVGNLPYTHGLGPHCLLLRRNAVVVRGGLP